MCNCVHIFTICVTLFHGTQGNNPSVPALLDLYRANQDKARSFHSKTEDISESTDSTSSGTRFTRTVSDIRVDGDKIDLRSHVWRGLTSDVKDAPMDQATFSSLVWDGKSLVNYHKTNIGLASIKTNKTDRDRMVSITCEGARLTGILQADLEPVDSIIREAETAFVEERMDEVDGFPCYVITAVSRNGSYRVWINPERGYNIAKAEVEKKGSDLVWGRPLDYKPKHIPGIKISSPIIASLSFSIKNIRFENVDNVWIPMEADWDSVVKYNDGSVAKGHNHYRRTEITLNPDHDAIGSFKPDIPDGTRVIVEDSGGVRYRWFGGRAIGDVDTLVVDALDKVVEQEMAATTLEEQQEVPEVEEVADPDTQPYNDPEGTEIQPANTGGRTSHLGVVLVIVGTLLAAFIGCGVFLRIRGRVHA